MSALFNAMTSHDARTENGALSHSTSGNANVDYFFAAGATRNHTEEKIIRQFMAAFGNNQEQAVRTLLWARDAREGAGERRHFRIIFRHLAENYPEVARRIARRVVELGRWDDLFVLHDTPVWSFALTLIAYGLGTGDRLCAKWMPREGSAKSHIASDIRRAIQLSPKQYRKLLVTLSDTVEQKMCARLWDEIEYSHVPSVAFARYKKSFRKHDPEGFEKFIGKVKTGETKVNAGSVFPYDIVRNIYADRAGSVVQWDALPNWISSDESILPVIDVSGSMTVPVSGSVTALDVAVSLGMYCAERNEGLFKDQFITFSGNPTMHQMKGDIAIRYNQIYHSNWQMNTDINKVFRLILDKAKTHGLSQKDLPTKVLIISDMEFDFATSGRYNSVAKTNYEQITADYEAAGYERPQLVFWNVNSRSETSPVKISDGGTALVSGFSPSIMKTVLSGKVDIMDIFLRTIMVDRYDY